MTAARCVVLSASILDAAPDETTICKFRGLVTEAESGAKMLTVVNERLASRGYRVQHGTIVDATIIHAPTSTKNQTKTRDPEMHQTKNCFTTKATSGTSV